MNSGLTGAITRHTNMIMKQYDHMACITNRTRASTAMGPIEKPDDSSAFTPTR